jgi:hypothetical protein
MFNRHILLALLAPVLLLLSGCADKLNITKSYEVSSVESKAIELPAQKVAQTINIDFSATGDAVSVLVFKEEDSPPGDRAISNADATKALGKKINSKADKFSVDVPANTATRVVIWGTGKKSEVTIKIDNKK